ncbi:DUF5694 domain-containing protein [Lysobacter sp. Root604]|uniref:DUF5694 domain-containing protein n=1 Tax=Lysobacter sp. Root604 TaxID=1736568 RepID=UPI0009E83B15|nr:DUF5694 domain-containing protein [Lysobacter sp. Root604]
MARTWAIWGLFLGLIGPGPACAQVDLSTLDQGMQGTRTQVLVLGSVHLSQMPEGFERASLAPVLERLAAFKPDIITIEALSGEQCDLVARHPAIYGGPDGPGGYCRKLDAIKAATGLDVPTAIGEVHKTLKQWPAAPTPAQRRRLASLFLAADDRNSALVQWWQLPESERRVGDGLDDALVAMLEKAALSNNENASIAARLAARLGLQRVHAVDDHTGDNVDVSDVEAFGKAVQQAWAAGAPAAQAMRDGEDALSKAGDMLGLYRYINRPEAMRIAIAADFGAALKDPSPQRYGQLYVAGWETRNLRMVANIRETFRERPGARVLSIVGSSHKPWFDSLLGQMQGVEIVDAEQVLK